MNEGIPIAPLRRAKPKRYRFVYLIFGLLIIGIGAPVMEAMLGGSAALFTEAVVALSLLAALWSVVTTRRDFLVAIAFFAANMVANSLWILADSEMAARAAHATGFSILVIVAFAAIRWILEPGPVTFDKMIGGLCVYIMIGIGWGELYQLLYSFDPNSFSGVGEQTGHFLSWRLNYFSFVTLTTLGYGDILPATPLAQSITVLETLVGQLYLAVLVAALVSAFFADEPQERNIPRSENADKTRR